MSAFFADSVLRFDGRTGDFIDVFVPAGTGGLDGPVGLAFGADGHLYVGGYQGEAVLRFDGVTGAFLGVFADPGTAVSNMVFGPDCDL